MLHRQRHDYLALRRQFEPATVRLVIIGESPPVSGKYFYNFAGAVSEPLFAALMQQLNHSPTAKEAGLREFQRRGWLLVDATYEPVNRLDRSTRDMVMVGDYPLLRNDLAALLPDRSVPLILIKANVCRLLEGRLRKDGFSVLNKGRVVFFPGTGRQRDFQQQFGAILKSEF